MSKLSQILRQLNENELIKIMDDDMIRHFYWQREHDNARTQRRLPGEILNVET